MYYEIDEDNVIRAMHPSGPEDIIKTKVLSSEYSPPSPVNTGPNPIQWRSHDEVAIEVDKYKRALALHDLVDENNTQLMVINKDHALFQGRADDVFQMRHTWWESRSICDGDEILIFLFDVSEGRQKREGGLVNIHYEYIPMDWSKAEKLLTKKFPAFPDGVLMLMECRVPDRSPPGQLKLGRRLVQSEPHRDAATMPRHIIQASENSY